MDTTIQSLHDFLINPQPVPLASSTTRTLTRIQRITLVTGLVGLVVYFLARPETQWFLPAAFGLVAISTLIDFSLRWRDLRRAAARQDWRRHCQLQEVIQRFEAGYDVVSPIVPTIELDGQTLVVLRTWSIETGKAILLLDRDGRAIQDQDIWRKSAPLIEFANASLPGVARNRRAIINTNLFARNQGAKRWKRALIDNQEVFKHLGLAADCQMLIEQWEVLEAFLSLRIALFQSEENVVEQVIIPANDQKHMMVWIDSLRRIHEAMETLTCSVEKIASASARLLTGWLENKTGLDWNRTEELEAGLKFAYLLQTLLLRTLNRWYELENPDLKTFQRGLELARETGLMITPLE
jgi:hypothetical protein